MKKWITMIAVAGILTACGEDSPAAVIIEAPAAGVEAVQDGAPGAFESLGEGLDKIKDGVKTVKTEIDTLKQD